MAQVAREKALNKFREDKIQVLVATDVAARGIDVAGVSHVVNYTCPEDDKTYVHRIGRTGRAGASGIAITLVDATDVHRWKMINKALDLPFDEPLETYSTSEHLFHDQGIPAGTKGRVVPPAPVERKPREGDSRGSRGGSQGSREGGERTSAPRNRDRNRTRTRSGEQVAGEQPAVEAGATGTATGERPAASANRRRRRRPSGTKPAADAS
jgi:superfamily II DNA/RNA helicase